MKRATVVVIASLLLSLLPLALCAESYCSYTAPNGNFYQFSGLAACGKHTDTTGEWTLSVCCPVAPIPPQDANVACRNGKCYGHSMIFNFEGRGKDEIALSYGGDAGGVHYTFVCDKSYPTKPSFEYMSEYPAGQVNFLVRTMQACPGVSPLTDPAFENPVYVHLVPHSHDDVGWLITIDQYYKGEVKKILDGVVECLAENKNRTFIYVEQAYFWRWWTDTNTTDEQRATFNQIYKNGQFEFVIGGWVMQDEACTTYGADVNQMTLGHQFLLNTFGALPSKGWQIDPFGASSVTPTLNKLSGFDAHLIDRITNKDYYKAEKLLQFQWYGSPSLGDEAMIFTEIMNGGTDAYCDWLEVFAFDKVPIDFLDVKMFSDLFRYMTFQRVETELTNHILAQWGCDFQFQEATKMFPRMDYLLAYLQSIESETQLFVKYTTLSDYFSAVMSTPNITWPTNHGGDFFPLLEDLYWTGYFTSRSVLKGIVRQGEATALATEQIYSIGRTITAVHSPTAYDMLGTLRMANADAQHHDGVTGTSEPGVVEMYANDLTAGIANAMQATAPYLSQLVTGTTQALTTSFDALLNIQANQIIPVVFYNSLSWPRDEFAILPTNSQGFNVVDQNKQPVPYQVNPTYFSDAVGKYNLFFQISVAPLGFTTYFISLNSSAPATSKQVPITGDTTIQNSYVQLNISSSTGLLSEFSNKKSNVALSFAQNLLQYESSARSGAYAFNPKGPAAPITSSPPKSYMITGNLLTEVVQVLPAPGSIPVYAQQAIRVYQAGGNANMENFAEMRFEIGVLPNHTEIITRFDTNIQNGNPAKFFTDDNGFEYQQRVSAYPGTIGGSHLPLVYASGINDSNYQLTVIAERTHSCSSLETGQFEVMLHRNPDSTDDFGPALLDQSVTHPVLRLVVDTPSNSALIARIQPHFFNFPIVPFVGTPISSMPKNWQYSSSFLANPLPYNVHLLSVNALNNNSTEAILRLTHLFAVGEDPKYSQPVTVNLSILFSKLTIISCVETTLTANKAIQSPSPMTITLTPKQIRTFIVQFPPNPW